MEQITITVGPDGSTEVSAQCIKGKACQDVTRQIEEALGRTVKDKATSEMYEGNDVKAHR